MLLNGKKIGTNNLKISYFTGHGGLSIAGPGETEKIDSMLVMSGGEGYIDFRLGEYWQYMCKQVYSSPVNRFTTPM